MTELAHAVALGLEFRHDAAVTAFADKDVVNAFAGAERSLVPDLRHSSVGPVSQFSPRFMQLVNAEVIRCDVLQALRHAGSHHCLTPRPNEPSTIEYSCGPPKDAALDMR